MISKPEQCFVRLQNVGCLSNTLLAVFSLGGSSLLDNSILISSPKISAFISFMEYFDQAKKQGSLKHGKRAFRVTHARRDARRE